MKEDDDGELLNIGRKSRIIPPAMRRIEPSGKLPAVRPSIDITEQMRDRHEDLYIDASTCVSHYSSGGIDWDMTISGLMN